MKFKRIMLITLLLAVLTIGAVSAADDVDALAVDDTGDDIAASPQDDTPVSDENSGELLANDEPSLDTNNIFMGSDNITYRDGRICEISDVCTGVGNSRVSVYANESQVFEETFASDGMVHYVLAKELNGTFNGFYNIKVVYTQSNGVKGYNEQLTYFDNIVGKTEPPKPADFNVTIAEELDIDADRDKAAISWYVPATVFDGRIDLDGDISGYKFLNEYDADSYMEFKLYDLSFTKPGTYDIVVNYINVDDETLELARGTLNVTKTYSADDFIELYNKNINSADDFIFWVHELEGKRPEGKLSIFYNGNQAFTRTYIGTNPAYITGNDLMGYFEGECTFTVVYERDADGKTYSKNLTANFLNPIDNKAWAPEEFNVTFPNNEVTVNDENTVIMTYFVPEGIDPYSSALRLKYGPGSVDYKNIFLDSGDINKTKQITFGELYIFDPCTLNLEVSYYLGQDKILDIANSTLKVTKIYTANDFMELYSKTITDPTDYVCNVYDSDAGLVGEVTVLANNTQVYYKKFTDKSNTAVRINGNNLTGDLKGSYNIKVVYKRAADGKEYSKSVTIVFGSSEPVIPDTKPWVTFKPTADDIRYGQNAVIKVTAYDDYGAMNKTVSGNVLVEIQYFNGFNWVIVASSNVALTNGVGSATFSNLDAREYSVKLDANDTEAYNADSNSGSLTVKKAWSTILFYDTVVEIGAGAPYNLTVDFDKASGITAKVDGENVTVDGNVVVIPALSFGTHTLNISTIPDDNHIEDSKEITLNVTKPRSSIVMDKQITIFKGSSADVTVTIKDALGFNATIEGHPEALTVNGNVITISGLDVGTYTLSVTTIVDDDHVAVTEEATITVKRLTSDIVFGADSIVFDSGSSGSIIANVSNGTIANAIVIAHSEAIIKIEGNKITVSNLTAGNYKLSVTSKPIQGYSAVIKSVKIIVNQPPASKLATSVSASKVTVAYGTSKNIVVTLKDANNVALANKKVTVTINGKPYYGTTNDKGQASIAVPKNLAVKNAYSATITFAGDDKYESSTGKVNVVVTKAAPKLTAKAKTIKRTDKTKKYTVTLKTNLNKVLKNAKITVKVNKKTYTAKTNSKGVATFKLTKLTKKGKYTATVKYAGNSYYAAKSVNVKITIK